MRPLIVIPRVGGGFTAGEKEFIELWARMLGTAYKCTFDGDSGPHSAAGVEAIIWGKTLRAEGFDVVMRSLAESFPDTAVALLAEWERRLGLPIDPRRPVAERQAALLAKTSSFVDPTIAGLIDALRAVDPGAPGVFASTDFELQVVMTWARYNDAAFRAQVFSLFRPAVPSYSAIVIMQGDPLLLSIAVTPDDAEVNIGDSVQYTATGTYEDGSTDDLTAVVAWESSDVAVASSDGDGQFTTNNGGSCDVTATFTPLSGAPIVGTTTLTAV